MLLSLNFLAIALVLGMVVLFAALCAINLVLND